jgi:hypothetical protein
MEKETKIKKKMPFFCAKDIVLLVTSLILGVLCFLVTVEGLEPGVLSNRLDLLYFAIFSVFVIILGLVLFFAENFNKSSIKRNILSKIFICLLPGAAFLTYGVCHLAKIDYLIDVIVGIYWISLGIYLINIRKFKWLPEDSDSRLTLHSAKKWFSLQEKGSIFFVIVILISYVSIGVFNIDKYAAVDEPLWTYNRIPSYWEGVRERNWSQTLISDKPGITVALISGIGLIKEDPQNYDPISWNGRLLTKDTDIEKLNIAFRLPIIIFIGILLPLIYFLIERIFGKKIGQYAVILIGLSPILIGMSRIINPDALLWSIFSIAILSYLAYLKRRNYNYLYLSGIFFGLSLLTKYVSNILFVFILGLIFLEFALNRENYSNIKIKEYLKQSLVDIVIFSFISLSVFYLLLPEAWLRPQELLDATIESQAFSLTWRYFAYIIVSIVIDIAFFESFVYSKILNFFAKHKRMLMKTTMMIFLICIAFVVANVASSMKFSDFEKLLASPKASRHLDFITVISRLNVFFANFYPLVFGITPLAFFSLTFVSSQMLFKKVFTYQDKSIYFLILFVFLYYLGSAVTGVTSIVRYQIIVFPVILVISGVGIAEIVNILKKIKFTTARLVVVVLSLVSVYLSYPFYSSYASALLPDKYSLDLKDMGAGSYEAAEFLNSLPEAKNISVWTDKLGVCYFFNGPCYSGFNPDINDVQLDYIVVTSGREVRTEKMTTKNAPDFTRFYEKKDRAEFEINIDGRPGQFVKVFKNK